jgi:RNA polymerase sigma factor (sigma-70 family)
MMCAVEVDIPMAGRHAQRPPGLPGRLAGDERLARETGAGSDRAFTTLFQRYHPQLYRYCRGLTGNDHDAQDAVQVTFTKALVAMREGRRNAPLRPWLYRIAHNESISVIRSRNSLLVDLPADLEARQGVTDNFEDRERMATLLADLRELPERQRGALVMRELSGLSHEEIAEALQISVGAAKQSILEARRSIMEFAEGRAMLCDEIQRIVSDDDRRSLRSRRVRAHLRDCAVCAAFAEAIPRRRADMLTLWPALPAASSAGLLAKLTGAGSGHGGGGGLAAGSAAKGLGATLSAKAAAAAGVAVVATATATVGAVAVLHHAPTARLGLPSQPSAVSQHKTSGSGHGSTAGRVVSITRSNSNHLAIGKGLGTAAGKAAGQGSHGNGSAHHSSHPNGASLNGRGSSGSGQNGHGGGPATATRKSNSGHSAGTTTHGQSSETHGQQAKTNPSVAHKAANPSAGHARTRPTGSSKAKKGDSGQARATGSGTTKTAAGNTKTTTAVDTRTTGSPRTKTTTGSGRTKATGAGTTKATGAGATKTTGAGTTKTTGAGTTKTTGAGTTTNTGVGATTPAATLSTATSTVVAMATTLATAATTTASTLASGADNGHGNSATTPGQTGNSTVAKKNSK